MEIFLIIRRYEAKSSSGGNARNAQRPWCTAGRLAQVVEPHPRRQLGALVVLGRSFVNATLWKLSVPTLLLILTLKRMVSLLLK